MDKNKNYKFFILTINFLYVLHFVPFTLNFIFLIQFKTLSHEIRSINDQIKKKKSLYIKLKKIDKKGGGIRHQKPNK